MPTTIALAKRLSQFADENGNRFGVPLMVEDDAHTHRPIHAQYRAGGQVFFQGHAFANERQAISFSNQQLHLDGMRRARKLFDDYARPCGEF